MPKDYYAILGVQKGASDDEVKKAFRRAAHEHHPDKGGDPAKFKDINEAYQVLSDKQKRQMYDQFGSAAFEQGGPGAGGPGGFGGFGGGFGFDPSGFQGAGFEDLGDVLGEMFGFGGGRTRRESRGADIQMDVELSFKEAAFGVTKKLSLYKTAACSRCKGEGAEPGTKIDTCKTCSGQGQVRQMQRTMLGTIQMNVTCGACHGKGRVPEKPCTQCRGQGIERREHSLEVQIPAGIEDGQALQIGGQGEAVPHGRSGDLYLRVHVKGDPYFDRDGHDVLSTVSVPFSLLALGGELEVETLDGKQVVTVAEATNPGAVLTLRGKGIPYGRGSRGNHLLTLTVELPRRFTDEQRTGLEQLRKNGL